MPKELQGTDYFMNHPEFSRIAEEEAARASEADGMQYLPSHRSRRRGDASQRHHPHAHPKSGKSIALFKTPDDPEDMPALVAMTDEDARGLVQESLAVARAIRQLEMDPDWRRYP